MKKKILFASFLAVAILFGLVAMGYHAAQEGRQSSGHLKTQDVPLVVHLGQMRAGILRVVSSTSELIVASLQEEDETGQAEENHAAGELELIEAGSAEFERAERAIQALAVQGQMPHGVELETIRARYEVLQARSRAIVELLREEAPTQSIVAAKEAFEVAERAALEAVEHNLDAVREDVGSNLAALDQSIDQVLSTLVLSAFFALIVVVVYMRYVLALLRMEARARNEAVSANQAKSQFLATMSHELRTPLNGILGMAELLRTDPAMSNEQRCEYAAIIQHSGKTLLTLLNDILDLSKVEAGKMALSPATFDPARLVEDVLRLFEPTACANGLSIEGAWLGPPASRFRADRVRLQQMLSNYVGNAIKFTHEGFVRIEAKVIKQEAQHALIEFAVVDSGIGVPADKHAQLFNPFSQADGSTTREYGGTGLGLSIVRSLANLMGGDAGMESKPGAGSRFWFRVRAEICHARETETAETPEASVCAESAPPAPLAGQRRVMVVDDNPVNLKVTELLLKRLGVVSVDAENGQQALDILTGGEVLDLVLMDIQMPVMDGLTATTRIREWERSTGRARIPIVALTAGAFAEDQGQCLAAGMDDFLTKPINPREFRRMLDQWLEAPEPDAVEPGGH